MRCRGPRGVLPARGTRGLCPWIGRSGAWPLLLLACLSSDPLHGSTNTYVHTPSSERVGNFGGANPYTHLQCPHLTLSPPYSLLRRHNHDITCTRLGAQPAGLRRLPPCPPPCIGPDLLLIGPIYCLQEGSTATCPLLVPRKLLLQLLLVFLLHLSLVVVIAAPGPDDASALHRYVPAWRRDGDEHPPGSGPRFFVYMPLSGFCTCP